MSAPIRISQQAPSGRRAPRSGSQVRLEWGSATDVGAVRQVNEDAVLGVPPVFLVADGMGGYAAGDVASSSVVEAFSVAVGQQSVDPSWVLDCLRRVDEHLRHSIDGGTTAAGAAVVFQDGLPYWMVFNVGDSRVYHCVNGTAEQVTVDHSLVQELVDAGEISSEDARVHPQRNVITRAIGSAEGMQPDIWLLPMVRGARVMICSDGVTSELERWRIDEALAGSDGPQQAADHLVSAARAAGGRDNISAVVVDVLSIGADDDGEPEETVPRVADGEADDSEHTKPRAESVSQPSPAERAAGDR